MADKAVFVLTKSGYARFINAKNGTVWDENAGAMGAIGTVTSPNAAVAVPYTAAHKTALLTVPSALPANEEYSVLVYDVAAASAADEDDAALVLTLRKDPGRLHWSGEIVTSYKR